MIAVWGGAKLIKAIEQTRQGIRAQFELRGGSTADRDQARQWISKFLKDAPITGLNDNPG